MHPFLDAFDKRCVFLTGKSFGAVFFFFFFLLVFASTDHLQQVDIYGFTKKNRSFTSNEGEFAEFSGLENAPA